MIKQRFTYCLFIAVFVLGCSARQELQGPNIIWIVSDDLGTDIGCYGNEVVRTPNLDKLASESVRYTHLHTVTAVCSPSRSALITGMYPVSINSHQHRTRLKKKLPDGVEPITKYFHEAGYYVTNSNSSGKRKGKTDYNFEFSFDEVFDGFDWKEKEKDQPFFAQFQIFLPHRPFHADTVHPVSPEEVKIPPYYPDHPIVRKDWALYLETIQHVDERLGDLMDRLEEEGALENTVVFFFGDQGRPHLRAKQWLYDPGTNTPLMVRWPDGRDAGKVFDQLVSNVDIPVSSLSIAGIPVPEHLQGIDFLSGKDQERKHLFTMRDRRDETVDRIRAIRTKEFKYIRNFYPERPYTQTNAYKKFRYPALTLMEVMHEQGKLDEIQSLFMSTEKPEEELYDLKNDPFEVNNLAKNPEFQSVLNDLRAVLDEQIEKYDLGEYPESDEEIQANIDFMEKRFRKNMESIGLTVDASNEEFLTYWKNTLLGNQETNE